MYEKFLKINGTHPWREVSPEGYEDYPVYYRRGGRVIYFNYDLAREMGLIRKNHPNKMNEKLEQTILETFSIRILNEYDWVNKKSFPVDHLKDRLYMATRYLQLQHENKQGETSGDGRSIWNGYIRKGKRTFDVSSRGTGTTILSPGMQEADDHIETGSHNYGYSSGLADLEEMLGSAIMSEIFYREGIPTERCLAVIEFKDKSAIGVRTAPNLIRPAHIFRYLKLGSHAELKKSYDYFLKRQKANGMIEFSLKGHERFYKSLEYLTRMYAKLAAILEQEYIFNWLAWDGDNLLASGALLDYGSIRQFAAKHNKYRYEDVDRFSTCLTEQRAETRKIIQTFIQAVDFIVTKEKKNIASFDGDEHLALFDECFKFESQKQMLWRIGFDDDQIKYLIENHQEKIQPFRRVLNYFENIKSVEGEQKVPDGIDHPPVFIIRHILRTLPQYILHNLKETDWPMMPVEEFCREMAVSYATPEDLEVTDYRRQKTKEFQELYRDIVQAVDSDYKKIVTKLMKRSSVINYEYRRTGDGLTWIVQEAVKIRNRIKQQQFQKAIDRFIESQILIPGKWKPIEAHELKGKTMKSILLNKMQENLEIYHEMI